MLDHTQETENRTAHRKPFPVIYGLLLVLLFALPFEAIVPVVALSSMHLTNLEVILAVTILGGMSSILWRWRQGQLPEGKALRRLLWPALALLLAALISAALAPEFQIPALKSSLRLGVSILLMVVVWSQVVRREHFTGMLAAIVAGAAVAALLGLLEKGNFATLEPFFLLFKEQPTFVGTEIRVSGSFQYATIAAMYWEMALPTTLVLAATAQTRPGRWLALGAAWLLVTANVLTLTRAGLLTLFFLLGGLLVLSRTQPAYRALWRPAGLTSLLLVGLLVGLIAGNRNFRTRLITENEAHWFGAEYVVPEERVVTSGGELQAVVQVRNTGRVDWPQAGVQPFMLGARWLSGDGSAVYDVPLYSFALPGPVSPGEVVTLQPALTVELPPGTYRLSWGMHQLEGLSLYGRGVPEGETVVTVRPGAETYSLPATTPRHPRDQEVQAFDIVGRRDLWRAAVMMAADRPVWGQGLNSFRLLFGRYLGMDSWDTRNSANNLYLELGADVGVAGLLAAGWLVVTALVVVWRAPRSLWVIGLGFSLGAVLVHGLLDYFFEFLGVLLLFWVILGLVATLPAGETTEGS